MQVKGEGKEGERLASLAGTQLLACLQGPSCNLRDKALLTRWGERMCPEELFTTLGVSPEEETKEKKLQIDMSHVNKRLEMKRDRLGSFSEWGEANDDENATYTGVAAVPGVRVSLLEIWFTIVVVAIVGGALGL